MGLDQRRRYEVGLTKRFKKKEGASALSFLYTAPGAFSVVAQAGAAWYNTLKYDKMPGKGRNFMHNNKTARRLGLAVLYLAVFAAAVMYLRVTISVPPEGDDKLTLNGWVYALNRLSFWPYLVQDLQGRLRFFLLKEARFFPFHYPSAVALLFYRTMASYRLYIIAVSGAAALLVSRVAARLSRSNALALGSFALALAAEPIFNEGMYSYYAVPQRTLFWAAASWLCLFRWQDTHHRRWGAAAAVLAFLSCGTYETGYVYAVLAFLLWAVLARSVAGGLRGSAPVLGGTAVALCFHLLSGRNGGTGNALSLNLPQIARVTVQQMAASLPFLSPLLKGEDHGVITKGDLVWPLVLGLAAAALLLFVVPRKKLSGKTLGGLALLGLGLWGAPALLLSLSERYQQPEAITWKWGYIPAAASSIGLGLLLAAGIAALGGVLARLPKVPSYLLRAVVAVVLAAAIGANGAYTRACLRTHHAENLKGYNFFADTIRAGLADEVTADDVILCNENVWDTNTQAETNFFCRFANRQLYAQMPGLPLPDSYSALYAYQTYRNYGGYDLAWCGKLTDETGEVMDGMRVYVQGAYVPDNAVIKYKVRLPDGTEEAKAICLLDCDRTPRNEKGEYIATVEDHSILNAKVMIWDG